MSESQPTMNAGDVRRAAALIAHYGMNNELGIAAVLAEIGDARDTAALLFSVLGLYDEMVPELRTEVGRQVLSAHILRLAGIEYGEASE